MHTCIYAYTYASCNTHIPADMHLPAHIFIDICTYAHMHVDIPMRVDVCIYIYSYILYKSMQQSHAT